MDLVAICPVDKWLGVLCACADGGDAYAELWIGKAPLPAAPAVPPALGKTRAIVCSGGHGGRRCEAVELELGAPPPPRPPARGPGPARAMPAPPPATSPGPGPARAAPPAPAGAQLDMWGRR